MTALACQIIEPAQNVIRVGIENASQIQRKVAATVKYSNPSGVTNTIDANTPAIPWTSGFGNGDPAPTTPGPIDVTGTYGGRWVTFILAGANLSTQPMYVCQVPDWPAIAGPAGGRTVIPLDVWELHSWKYAGYEFLGDQATRQAGVATCTVPVNSDTSTPLTVTYPTAYPAAGVPTVLVSSSDVGWIATWSAVTASDFVLTLARRIPLTNPETGSVPTTTMTSGAGSATQTVTFPQAFQSAPVVAVQVTGISGTGGLGDYIGEATAFHTDGSGNIDSCTITFYYRPALSGTTGYATTGLSVDTIAVHNHPVPDPSGWSPGTNTGTAGAHSHGLTEPTSGGNTGHHHIISGGAVGTNTDIDATYAAFGNRAAPSVTKDASWLAVG